MATQSISALQVPSSYVSAIQQNVDAHTPYCKYWDFYHGPEKEHFGVSSKSLNALGMITSAAESFEREHGRELQSRSSKSRTEAASLREALSILQKSARMLDREIAKELRKHMPTH